MIELGLLKNMSLMLALTICALILAAFCLKHVKKLTPQCATGIEILGMANLWNKNKVVLLRAYGTDILIGVSDSNVQTLHVFDNKNISGEIAKIRDTKF